MIKNIHNLLRADDWKDGGNVIEIAKGRDYMPDTWAQIKRKIQRLWRLKRK